MLYRAPAVLAALLLSAGPALAAPPDADGAQESRTGEREVDVAADETNAGSAAEIARTLRDPARQRALASTAAVLTEMVLDLPLAPILRPLAEAAGKPDAVDPALTLRRSAPGADALPGQVARVLPRAMDAAGAASEGAAAMTPALRDLAERMRAVLREAPLGE